MFNILYVLAAAITPMNINAAGMWLALSYAGQRKGDRIMKRELGIARCGLACCLCSENDKCGGCASGECPDKDWCENLKCSREKGISNCFLCEGDRGSFDDCKKGLLAKIKPYGFTLFAKRYGVEALLDCLERNEKNGVVYHREGINGDYDDFDDVEELIKFIKSGVR